MAQHDDAPLLSEMPDTIAPGGLKEMLRDVVCDELQELIEEELTATIGAAKYERTDTRTVQRNGGRDRLVSTPAGMWNSRSPSCERAAPSGTARATPSGGSGAVDGYHDRLHHRHRHPGTNSLLRARTTALGTRSGVKPCSAADATT